MNAAGCLMEGFIFLFFFLLVPYFVLWDICFLCIISLLEHSIASCNMFCKIFLKLIYRDIG